MAVVGMGKKARMYTPVSLMTNAEIQETEEYLGFTRVDD